MVILDVTVSASATRASFFLIDRVRNQWLVGFPANVGLEPGVNDGAKRPLSRCQRRREAPIITVSRASPSRLGLRPRGSGFALAARCALAARWYEFVLYNLYKKCTNCISLYYTICITNVRIIWIRLYEFVTKLVKKKKKPGWYFNPGPIWLTIVAAARNPPPHQIH
jgi:hypothetical protein